MPYKEKKKGLKYKPEFDNAGPSSVMHDIALLFIFLACAALPVYTLPSLSKPVLEFLSNVGSAALWILALLVAVAVGGGIILLVERFLSRRTTPTAGTSSRQSAAKGHERGASTASQDDDAQLDTSRATPVAPAGGVTELQKELGRRRHVWKQDAPESIELKELKR